MVMCTLFGLAAVSGCGGGDSGGIEVDDVSPGEGPLGGGQTVVVKGRGFLAGGAAPNMALVGDALALSVSGIRDNEIRLVTPPGSAPGPVDITIFNSNGFGVAAGVYTYADPPAIESITPEAGSYRGGGEIAISGSGFRDVEAGQTTVTFGGAPAARVEVVDDGELRALVPRGVPYQAADVAVTNRRGSASQPSGYRYTVHGLLAATGSRSIQNEWGRLYAIDVDAGEAVVIGSGPPSGVALHALAAAPDGRVLGYSRLDSGLYSVDLASGQMTRLASVAPAGQTTSQLTDIEFRGNTLLGLDKALELLGTIDAGTGEFAPVGAAHPVHRSESIASDGATIWFLGNIADTLNLYTLDVSTGALSASLRTVPLYRGHGATYQDGSLYVAETLFLGGTAGPESRIHRIDPDSGALTRVADVPAFIHAMTVAP